VIYNIFGLLLRDAMTRDVLAIPIVPAKGVVPHRIAASLSYPGLQLASMKPGDADSTRSRCRRTIVIGP